MDMRIGLHMPGQKKMLDSLGLELSDGCKPPCKCWEFNPARLQEQPALLVVEPSLQLHKHIFCYKKFTNLWK